MANKKLNSIKWPNMPNDTYYLDAEKVKYDASETYPNGSVGKALQNKAEVDGSYESMTVGNAEQLVSNVRVNDQTPYLFRTSGGSVDIGDREYINGIVGGTVAWNQICTIEDFTQTAGTDTAHTQFNVPFNIGHKYLAIYNQLTTLTSVLRNTLQYKQGSTTIYQSVSANRNLAKGTYHWLFEASLGGAVDFAIWVHTPDIDASYSDFQLFDLTQMFGSTIADYIYALEQATAGAGVAFFKSLFPKPYYAYNAGELKSVSGLVSHDMVGFNAWDEEWELGALSATGGNATSSTEIRSKNYIPVVGGQTYYLYCAVASTFNYKFYDADKNFISGSYIGRNNTLIIPSDVRYMRFYMGAAYGATYNHDICINLAWDNSRNGEYEAYQKWSYPLDSDLELRGIPKLDASNNLYYDGDVYEPDGTVTRKYKAVTIDGSNAFSYQYNGTLPSGYIACFINFADKAYGIYNMISDKFERNNDESLLTMCGRTNNSGIQFTLPSTVTASNAGCKAWFTSNPTGLVYELATPTEETADPYTSPQIVNDFGTEEFVIDNTVNVPIPVGHNTDYPINLKAKVEMAPNSPSGDGDYIVRQTNGTNEYVPLVIEDALPTMPSTAGTYKLTVTVAEGSDPVLSWEAE